MREGEHPSPNPIPNPNPEHDPNPIPIPTPTPTPYPYRLEQENEHVVASFITSLIQLIEQQLGDAQDTAPIAAVRAHDQNPREPLTSNV